MKKFRTLYLVAIAVVAIIAVVAGSFHQMRAFRVNAIRQEIEDVMYRFYAGEINVLICTTIIETGLDIPNANTIIIDNAQNFGLSQLYQIKGRVGRSDRIAYAYLFELALEACHVDGKSVVIDKCFIIPQLFHYLFRILHKRSGQT